MKCGENNHEARFFALTKTSLVQTAIFMDITVLCVHWQRCHFYQYSCSNFKHLISFHYLTDLCGKCDYLTTVCSYGSNLIQTAEIENTNFHVHADNIHVHYSSSLSGNVHAIF